MYDAGTDSQELYISTANLKIIFNFSVCLTFNSIILCVYYSRTVIIFNYKEEVITFTDWIGIKTKMILELKFVQIHVKIIMQL